MKAVGKYVSRSGLSMSAAIPADCSITQVPITLQVLDDNLCPLLCVLG
jgi:hypothetical protein